MKKNKLKLLLSIIICFSLINIGGAFSYAGGGSSGGGGGGSVGPAPPVDFDDEIMPIAIFKKWQADKTGNYGPDKDKPVIINADLSFQIRHEGQLLNFEISRQSATQRIKNAPMTAGQSNQIAFIDFVTGRRIVEENNVRRQQYVTTIKDKDGKGYVAQFMSKGIFIKASTHEARIGYISVYKEPKIPTPQPPLDIAPQGSVYKKFEQPGPNATVYNDVKAKITISEIEKYKDYDENLEIVVRGWTQAPDGSENDPRNFYLPYPALEITVTNTYNPPVPEEEKPPVPPEENTPPKNPPKEKTNKPSVPNTGDSEAFMVLISLLAIGTAGAVITVKRKNS